MRFALLAFLAFAAVAGAQSPAPSATLSPPPSHFEGVDARGDQGMGFSHHMTGHHFHLFADGGAIEVAANDPKDAESREAIRSHLASIAERFAAGDFSVPMFIHATSPPGMATMQRLKREISYHAEETPHGAQVRIKSQNPEAIEAIHQFLRFQIEEHRTGDAKEAGKAD